MQELIGRLVAEEHYGLAVYVAKRWDLDASAVWEAWARSLILCALAHPLAVNLQSLS